MTYKKVCQESEGNTRGDVRSQLLQNVTCNFGRDEQVPNEKENELIPAANSVTRRIPPMGTQKTFEKTPDDRPFTMMLKYMRSQPLAWRRKACSARSCINCGFFPSLKVWHCQSGISSVFDAGFLDCKQLA